MRTILLTVSIFSACIMQHVAGAFLAQPTKAEEPSIAQKIADYVDMDFPLKEFRKFLGEVAGTITCKSWTESYGAEVLAAGCKQEAVLADKNCDAKCQGAFKKDGTMMSARCPATCSGGAAGALTAGALASSRVKASKMADTWAAALEKKFSLDSTEEKTRKAKKDKKEKKDKKDQKDKEDKKNEAEDQAEKLAAKKQKEDKAAVKVVDNFVNDKKDDTEEDKKHAKAVKVHADKDDAKKDDTKEDKKEAKADKVDAKKDKKQGHAEKVDTKKDATKVDKKDAEAVNFLAGKSEKKVDEAESDDDVQAEIKAEAMKADAQKTWKAAIIAKAVGVAEPHKSEASSSHQSLWDRLWHS